MTKYTAFIDATIVDLEAETSAVGGLLVKGDTVEALGKDVQRSTVPKNTEVVSCKGLHLMPGLVDMQVTTGEPGAEYRETLATASLAAAAGGVTSMVVTPDTSPVIDDAALVDFVARRSRDTALVRVYPMAAMTRGLQGECMSEFALLAEAGAVAFTDDVNTVMDSQVMHRLMEYAATFNLLLIHHTMDVNLLGQGVMNAGELATRLGLAGIPHEAETVILERDLRLVEKTGVRYHVAQLSSRHTLDVVRAAKKRGLFVTCSVSANHLTMNEQDVRDYRTFAKLLPPLRDEQDREALVAGVADGTIDVIVSAHRPRDVEEKRLPFAKAAFGSVGLETSLSSALTLVHNGELSLYAVLRAMSQTPANLLRIPAGRLCVGGTADFILVDIHAPWRVDVESLHSKSKNSAIEGRLLQGLVKRTIVGGATVFAREK